VAAAAAAAAAVAAAAVAAAAQMVHKVCLACLNSLHVALHMVQVDESAIIESLELACNPAKPDGAWITHYDMVEDGDRIKLVDTQQVRGYGCVCN
jgi:hypothetical protein